MCVYTMMMSIIELFITAVIFALLLNSLHDLLFFVVEFLKCNKK